MRNGVVGLSLILLFSSLPVLAASPPKPGATCKKLESTQTFQGKTYSCVKSGKKLIWNKGVISKKVLPEIQPKPSHTSSPSVTSSSQPSPTISPSLLPSPQSSPTATPSATSSPQPSPTITPESSPSPNRTPSPSATPSASPTFGIKQKRSVVTYSPPSESSENAELCKVKQLSNEGTKSGFPAQTKLYQGTGIVKWALIPLDFADLPGESNFLSRVQIEMDSASEWAAISSEGQLKIEWKVHDKWIRLPGLSTEYAIPVSDNKGFSSVAQQSVWTRAITEADKYFDFTGIQAVQFILPAGQKIIEYGIKGNTWFDVVKNYTTNEGTRIELFSIPSTFNEELNSGRNYWSWWMYHYVVGLGVAKFGGSRIATPLMPYLIQGSTEGERELGGWTRFLIGWLPENRVYCRTATNLTNLDITLVPLPDIKSKGFKLAVFPLSPTKALILESRRVTKFSCTTNTERNGVLAYIYDGQFGHQDDYFQAVAPPGRAVEQYSCFASPTMDFLLHEGEKVTYEEITIEMLAHGDFDRLRLTRKA